MESLAMNFGDLRLELTLVDRQVEVPRQPYLDWLTCGLTVEVPDFSGSVRWNVMLTELTKLTDDLDHLYNSFPELGAVAFDSVEHVLALEFIIESTGSVHGEFCVRGDCMNGPRLSGIFKIDQSYLPELVRGLRRFLEAASEAA